MSKPSMKLSLDKKHNLTGWMFLTPGALLILFMSFVPMIKALILSFKTGNGGALTWSDPIFRNYSQMFKDTVFIQSIKNTFFYLIIQVPIMLILALILASILNNRNLRFKGTKIGILSQPYSFLTHVWSARIIIVLALLWRWTGYNMVFYLSGLQNIEYSVYEASKIDGASPMQTFFKITVPLLKPTILLTAIMSTNGTLQLFDESVNLTDGGPANASITMSHYIYNLSFKYVPKFGYAAAMSFLILILVAILAFVQMKVGDKRD